MITPPFACPIPLSTSHPRYDGIAAFRFSGLGMPIGERRPWLALVSIAAWLRGR
jgi:hypothetical protein